MARRDDFTPVAESIPFDPANSDFTSDNVQDAIEEAEDLATPLRVPINLVYNGTLSGGDFIGYSNLLPGDDTPIIIPITGNLVEFTWSNSSATADFALTFRLNSTTATPFFTWSVDNTQSAAVTVSPQQAVTAGDELYIQYVDEGTNARDAAIVLLFRS